MHVIYRHHCHEVNTQKNKNEMNLQCTTIGPRFDGKWYNLFKISRTANVSLGTPWSGHSGYWICKTDNGASSTCNNMQIWTRMLYILNLNDGEKPRVPSKITTKTCDFFFCWKEYFIREENKNFWNKKNPIHGLKG